VELDQHVEHAFQTVKLDRKIPVFVDGAEPGEVVLEKWVQDPLVAEEMKKYVTYSS
jgi:hypothetical protein